VNRILTLPNVLSGLRLLLIPVIVVLILKFNPSLFPILISVYVLAVGLDFLDGYLARRLSLETELGKILDPLADKLLTFCSIVALSIVTDFPLWITIPIVLRDLVILLASTMMYKRKHLVKGSIVLGKITFFLISLLIFVYIFDLSEIFDLRILKQFFAPVSLVFVLWSFDEYFLVYQRVKRNGRT